MSSNSSVQLIRNATVVLHYAGKKFLIDPMLADKGAYAGFPGTINSHLRNPLEALPVNPASLYDVDAIIVTHLHADHWDQVAIQTLPKNKPVFAQNEADATVIRAAGFQQVRSFANGGSFEGVSFFGTECQHGSDEAYSVTWLAEFLGQASGLLFKHPAEKTVYMIGDSIWIPAIEATLKEHTPDVVLINAGFATLEKYGAIIMGKEDFYRVHQIVPAAKLVAIHMEALNHCLLSRRELHEYVNEMGIADKVVIPRDGDIIKFAEI
ncbi:hypothetical protein A4H97_16340 [Niastella yeongjuensis]|uniref:Metallo-beta-lactamase domain-containing protein n=1 Tax=Niastella yeongjuensis TaxID=354355 RepID=A0A1V9E154_9BACT|nr:MBL fold metallo-hydrolase [Niastella yeongjuensis]OQP39791.1 hypothetical protein A4H97_16340 [Niastella yeongjuensis]SEO05566.1 L-ascorbate metabolism protein UlaG, beta-lactamase superfamily [Niastella yeongjuensis]